MICVCVCVVIFIHFHYIGGLDILKKKIKAGTWFNQLAVDWMWGDLNARLQKIARKGQGFN